MCLPKILRDSDDREGRSPARLVQAKRLALSRLWVVIVGELTTDASTLATELIHIGVPMVCSLHGGMTALLQEVHAHLFLAT